MDKIKKLLFKVVSFEHSPGDIYAVFSIEEKITTSVNEIGKLIESRDTCLRLLDIDSTIQQDKPVTRDLLIDNEEAFLNVLQILNVEDDIIDGLEIALEISSSSMMKICKDAMDCRTIINSLSHIMNDEKIAGSEGSITLTGGSEEIANIVFKTISGETANLKEEDIAKLAGIIRDIIEKYSNIFEGKPSEVRAIKSELEYKVIDALPDDIRTQKLDINVDSIIKEIQAIQEENRED